MSVRSIEVGLNRGSAAPHTQDLVLVLTRFQLRNAWQLVQSYSDYRHVARDARGVEGLLRSSFLIEDAHTFFTLSIWRHDSDIPRFGTTVASHVAAGNRVFPRLRCTRERGPEIASTKWRLTSGSNNLNWDSLDLRSALERVDRR